MYDNYVNKMKKDFGKRCLEVFDYKIDNAIKVNLPTLTDERSEAIQSLSGDPASPKELDALKQRWSDEIRERLRNLGSGYEDEEIETVQNSIVNQVADYLGQYTNIMAKAEIKLTDEDPFLESLNGLQVFAETLIVEPPYTLVMSENTEKAVLAYMYQLEKENTQPGELLAVRLKNSEQPLSEMSLETFVRLLLATKQPQCYAEKIDRANDKRWNLTEEALLGNIACIIPTQAYNNGAWNLKDETIKHYGEWNVEDENIRHNEDDNDAGEWIPDPLNCHLGFVPGALFQHKGKIKPSDAQQLEEGGGIDEEKYIQFYRERLTPVLLHISQTAQAHGKKAVITLPGIGCGEFAGRHENNITALFYRALQTLLEENREQLAGVVELVYFGTLDEANIPPQKTLIGDEQPIHLCYGALNNDRDAPRLHQLERPEEYFVQLNIERPSNDELMLFSLVAWDHFSWPGNDVFQQDKISRWTDDGVKGASTSVPSLLTSEGGNYNRETGCFEPEMIGKWSTCTAGTDPFGNAKQAKITVQKGNELVKVFEGSLIPEMDNRLEFLKGKFASLIEQYGRYSKGGLFGADTKDMGKCRMDAMKILVRYMRRLEDLGLFPLAYELLKWAKEEALFSEAREFRVLKRQTGAAAKIDEELKRLDQSFLLGLESSHLELVSESAFQIVPELAGVRQNLGVQLSCFIPSDPPLFSEVELGSQESLTRLNEEMLWYSSIGQNGERFYDNNRFPFIELDPDSHVMTIYFANTAYTNTLAETLNGLGYSGSVEAEIYDASHFCSTMINEEKRSFGPYHAKLIIEGEENIHRLIHNTLGNPEIWVTELYEAAQKTALQQKNSSQ